ncbi:MAG: hypothetical protein AAFQ80_13030 [Cyanobacteria bacterium J06621_8]
MVLILPHGVGNIRTGLSDYYLVEEAQAIYRGMAIAKLAEGIALLLVFFNSTNSTNAHLNRGSH